MPRLNPTTTIEDTAGAKEHDLTGILRDWEVPPARLMSKRWPQLRLGVEPIQANFYPPLLHEARMANPLVCSKTQ
jgi:hypothetical protein